MRRRLRLRVEGLVQGVGFRPFVHRLASERGLEGWIGNTAAGVTIELEGQPADLETFLTQLQGQPPPHCRLERLEKEWLALEKRRTEDAPRGFRILAAEAATNGVTTRATATNGDSPAGAAPTALILPDLAPCPACLAEIRDPSSRRYRYPFNSCAHCGPRYSLVRELPFERANTTLAAFPLCSACRADYGTPADRRFHAQTIGCPACGPQLSWWEHGKRSGATGHACLCAAAAALAAGKVVALKGLGGFQLLVKAGAAEAVAELRRRKGRPEKPFALLAPHLDWVRAHCQLSAAEESLLKSPAAPIVLLRRQGGAARAVAANVAPDNPWLGVMLASTPLHALLLEAVGVPLVATSANRSGEPLCFEDQEALVELANLADGWLTHDRPIANPVDDGVAQVVAGRPMLLRHARGNAPTALDLSGLLPAGATPEGVVAMGGQLKSAFAIGSGRRALLGPYQGDLGSIASERRFRRDLDTWLERHQLQPRRIGMDEHPGYEARRIGLELAAAGGGLPALGVQHHHAHLLACLAEHGLEAPQVGVAWDGAGHGDDGTVWGGECLRLEAPGAGQELSFTRLARLRPFPLPGGERAMREPRRAALGLLFAAFGADALRREDLPCLRAFDADERRVLGRMLEARVQTPLCSSIGRLFDAMASLLGLCQRCSFEGQAALRLEAAALEGLERETPAQHRYRITLDSAAGSGPADSPHAWLLDWQPLLSAVLDDLARERSAAAIALDVHRALARLLVDLAERLSLPRLLLSGGCFQNRLLLELAVEGLQEAGVEAIWPQRIPCNDGGLAVGQLLATAWGNPPEP